MSWAKHSKLENARGKNNLLQNMSLPLMVCIIWKVKKITFCYDTIFVPVQVLTKCISHNGFNKWNSQFITQLMGWNKFYWEKKKVLNCYWGFGYLWNFLKIFSKNHMLCKNFHNLSNCEAIRLILFLNGQQYHSIRH